MVARLGIVHTKLLEDTRPYTLLAFDIGMAVQTGRSLDKECREIVWMEDQLIFESYFSVVGEEKYWPTQDQKEVADAHILTAV